MYKILLIIFVSLNCIYAQNKYDNLAYYEIINQAELAILKDDFDSAIQYYLLSAEKVKLPLSVDCLNAAKIASILNKDSIMYLFLSKAILTGAKLNSLEKMKYFKKKRLTEQWNNFRKKVDYLEKEKNSFVDWKLASQIDSLHRLDQQARKSKYQKVEKMNYIDSCAYRFIAQLLENNTFPYEYQIRGGEINKGGIKTLLLHNIGRFDEKQLAMLKICVQEGKLHPQYYSHFIDRRFTDNKQNPYYYLYYTILGDKNISLNEKDIFEIDQKRNEIYLLGLKQSRLINEKLQKLGLNLKFL